MILQIARTLANLNLSLEYSGEVIDEDDVVKILEHMTADLQELDPDSRKALSDAFRAIAAEYEGEYREFIETLPYAIGLEDEEAD